MSFSFIMFLFTVILRVLPASYNVSQTDFRGFFIQARLMADDSNVGGFQNVGTNDPYRLSSCPTPSVRNIELFIRSWLKIVIIIAQRTSARSQNVGLNWLLE